MAAFLCYDIVTAKATYACRKRYEKISEAVTARYVLAELHRSKRKYYNIRVESETRGFYGTKMVSSPYKSV